MKSPEQELIERFQKADFDGNEIRQSRIFAKVTARKQKRFAFAPVFAAAMSVLLVAGALLWRGGGNIQNLKYEKYAASFDSLVHVQEAPAAVAEVSMQQDIAAVKSADMDKKEYKNSAAASLNKAKSAGRGGAFGPAAAANAGFAAVGESRAVMADSTEAFYDISRRSQEAAAEKALRASDEDTCARLTARYLLAQNDKHRAAYYAVLDSCRNIGEYDSNIKETMESRQQTSGSGIFRISKSEIEEVKSCIDKFKPKVNPITLDKSACGGAGPK